MVSATVPVGEDPLIEPKYPEEDATQGPFGFGSPLGFEHSGFYAGYYYHRETGAHLKKILFPELVKNEKARNQAQRDAWVISGPWVKAQLQFYGIHFDPDLDFFKAKALLLTSVAYGLCDAVPPQILKIKATLKAEYDGRMEEYRKKMKAYRAQELPRRIKEFEACSTPSEEVKYDVSLFLGKYFLDKDRKADRTKTPGLILLPGYTDKGLALTRRTERVPSLHVANGGLGGEKNVMVIGWNRAKVNQKARQIDMEQTPGGVIERLCNVWDQQMTMHKVFVHLLRDRTKAPIHEIAHLLFEYDPHGKYAVECKAIENSWPLLSHGLTLRIMHGGKLAIFDLGVCFGLMVLAKTQEKVAKRLKDGKWDADDTDDDSGDEDPWSDEKDSHQERKGGHSENFLRSVSHRSYFQWRGYNTITGAIQFDPQNKHTGYLDFYNDDDTIVEGNLVSNAAGSSISFRGFRVPGLGGPLTMDWNALSHIAPERAQVREPM